MPFGLAILLALLFLIGYQESSKTIRIIAESAGQMETLLEHN
jgi:hypothetical protein